MKWYRYRDRLINIDVDLHLTDRHIDRLRES